METVWKKMLELNPQQFIDVPKGATFLCAREQHGKVAVWFRCNPEETKTDEKLIRMLGTGHCLLAPGEGKYLGTAALDNGALIIHVFDETPPYNLVF